YFGPVGAPPFVFPVGQRVEVTVETTGSSVNPAMPLTRLHSADDSFIQVFTPVIPNSGVIEVDSTQPLEVTWQRPAGHPEEPEHNKLIVALWDIAGPSLVGEVRCGFDLAKGRGVIPMSLLHEVKVQVDPVNPIPGAAFRVLVGDRRGVRAGGVSY